MKDETAGVALERFVRLTARMLSYLVDDNSRHKKAKGVNQTVEATISYNKNNHLSLNKKYLRYSMNRIQSKDHRI